MDGLRVAVGAGSWQLEMGMRSEGQGGVGWCRVACGGVGWGGVGRGGRGKTGCGKVEGGVLCGGRWRVNEGGGWRRVRAR